MAILKSEPYKFGLNVTYWSVDEYEIKYDAKLAIVVVHGFISEESKKVLKEGKVVQKTIRIDGDDFDFVKGENTEEKIYNHLMTSKKEFEVFKNEDGTTRREEVEKNFFADGVLA